MSLVAAIGAAPDVEGFALAGALVSAADDADQVRAAWRELPGDVAVVVLTAEAAAALPAEAREQDWPLLAVLP